MKYPINVVPLHDCVPLVVDSSQKNEKVFISLCLKPEMWQKVAKFKGPNTFARHCRSWMAGSLATVMYWAVSTTLCSALGSDAEQLPYQAVMQPVRMLSMVQLYYLLRIWGPTPNLFSLLRGKSFCCALFLTVFVYTHVGD